MTSFQEIKDRGLIKPFIAALLHELNRDDVSVFDSAIEMPWYRDMEYNGADFLFELLQATPEQLERAYACVTSHPTSPQQASA